MDDLVLKLKAVADETRLNILKLLLAKNFCVKALAQKLNMSESAVSQQLKVLRKADLVMGEKKGYFVHYVVKKENLFKIVEGIKNIINNVDGEKDCCIKE